MSRPAPAVLLALPLVFSLGCRSDPGNKGITLDGEGGDGSSLVLELEGPIPEYGSDAGGVEVEIIGGPFASDSVVRFDGAEAEVLEWSTDHLLVATPAAPGEPGWVDVEVSSGGAAASLEQSYRYFEDGEGLAGALGALEWYELLGGYWEDGSTDFGTAWWGLIEPQDITYSDLFGGGLDGCVTDPAFPEVQVMDLGVDSTTLLADGADIRLDAASDAFFDASLTAGDYAPGVVYDLDTVSGDPLPDFEVPELAATPGSFTLQSPALGGDEAITLSQSALDFRWSGAEGEETYIMVTRYDADFVEQETVGCVVDNDGSFSVPGGAWTRDWQTDDWIFVYVGAAVEGEGIIPLNNADSRVTGIWWLLGAALAE